MDLSALFSEAAKLGFVVFLLLVAVVGLVKWVRRVLDSRDQSNERDRLESIEREARNRDECLARERTLAERLTKIEDRQFSEHSEILRRCANALETNARALEKLTDRDTGLHLALVEGSKSR